MGTALRSDWWISTIALALLAACSPGGHGTRHDAGTSSDASVPPTYGKCDAGAPALAQNASGSRLKWQPWQSASGVGLGGEWLDSERSQTCEHGLTADQTMRCLPTADLSNLWHFEDGSCTKRTASILGQSRCSTYLKVFEDFCSNTQRFFPIEGEILSPLFDLGGSGCRAASTLQGKEYVYKLGPELSYPDWVSATETVECASTRLRARYLVGGDGSRNHVGWFDSVRSEPCIFHRAADGKFRCLPDQPLRANVLTDQGGKYSDSNCSAEVDIHTECAGPTAKYVVLTDDRCGEKWRVHRLGEAATARYQDTLTTYCEPMATEYLGRQIGAAIEPTQFEEAELVEQPGASRLRRVDLVTPDGASQPWALYDTARQESCELDVSEDHRMRCLPVNPGPAGRFADPQCKQRLMEWRAGCMADSPTSAYAADFDEDPCAGGWIYYSVGESVSPTSLYALSSDGRCSPDLEPDEWTKYYVLTKLDPNQFESVSLLQ
jgi:hypothetical protein